ncbi:MAG: hypothetical protein MK439_05380, partial [SAR324 cluster bacterium]|nr:hypothetical protein [SAR324 cluster bacterium]
VIKRIQARWRVVSNPNFVDHAVDLSEDTDFLREPTSKIKESEIFHFSVIHHHNGPRLVRNRPCQKSNLERIRLSSGRSGFEDLETIQI